MTTWRLVAAVTGALLSAAPIVPAAATDRPPRAAGTTMAAPRAAAQAAAVPAAGAPAGSSAPVVRCPTVATPPVKRPPRPSPPPADPVLRAVGGEQLATPGLAVPPGSPPPPAITATSWLVADLDSGAVLGGCGPHEPATPASVQKLLLAATVLPKLDRNRTVTVTQEDLDFEVGSSAVGLLVGGRYTVELLWLGLLLNSGNDAANVLARLGGADAGVAGTIEAMNAEARRLGAYQTRAVTPSGLDAPGQFTSAYDLALIARACFADPTFRRYQRTERAQVPAQPPKDKRGFQIQNDNQLLFQYPGAIGGKTGFTDLARHTYVGVAERSGRRLVVSLLGGEARPLRGWQQGAALLDWGFRLPPTASVGRLVAPGEPDPRASAEVDRGQDTEAAGSQAVARQSDAQPTRSEALVPASAWSTGAAAGVALLLVLGPLVVLLVTRRGRRARVRRRAG